MTLDELRNRHPDLSFAVYAMQPGGPVTFEIHTPDGQLFTFKATTEEAAIEDAFPTEPTTPQQDIFD